MKPSFVLADVSEASAVGPSTAPQSKFWTKPEVLAFCRISDSTLSRLERAGEFPKRMVVGRRKVVWLSASVENWVTDLAREAKAG